VQKIGRRSLEIGARLGLDGFAIDGNRLGFTNFDRLRRGRWRQVERADRNVLDFGFGLGLEFKNGRGFGFRLFAFGEFGI